MAGIENVEVVVAGGLEVVVVEGGGDVAAGPSLIVTWIIFSVELDTICFSEPYLSS